jgi:F-type H+-transporting ATPase subunit b
MDQILKDIAEFVNGCLGPLGNSGDIGTWLRDFCIQLIATLLLFIVVKIFLWKPLTEFLEARKDMMDKDLVEAQQAKERAEQLEAELKVKYDAAKVEIQKLLKEAEAQGNLRKEEIINEAKLEATRRLTMAKEEIEREIAMQEDDIRNQIISIAFLAAEKIVGNQIDQEQYLEAVTKIIESGMNNE